MFDDAEWRKLIVRLTTLTSAQRLEWHESDGTVEAVVAGTKYVIGSVDNDDRQPFFLAVIATEPDPWAISPQDREIARLESTPEVDRDWGSEYAPPAAELIHDLRRLANRSAKGAPQLLSKLLDDLDAVDQAQSEPPF